MSVLRILTLTGLCLGYPFSVYGENTPASKPAAEVIVEKSVADVEQLLKQLDADAFDQREAASQALREAGIANLPDLEKTIAGESLEAASRAYDIVVYFYEKGNATDKAAATEVLKRVVAGKSSSAMRAKQLLEKPLPTTTSDQLPDRVRIRAADGFRIMPDGIHIEALAVGGKNVQQSVSVSFRNDEKTLKFSNNDQKIELTESADKSIKGQITQKKDDKDTTEKIEVKDAEELKEKFPAAHKIYEQYILKKGGAGGIEFRVDGIGGIRVDAIGGEAGDIKLPDPADLRRKQLEAVKEAMQKFEEGFKDIPEEAKAKIRELQEQQIEKLEEQIQKFDAEFKELEAKGKVLEAE
jgi:hypothetical protein